MDLVSMAKQFPDMTVSIRVSDLLAANEALVRKVRIETEREQEKRDRQYGDHLIKKETARLMLGSPDKSTMWRWEQQNYLTPVKIGSRVFYRSSDIDRLIRSHEEK